MLFYVVTFYVFAEMAWWGYLLIKAEPDRKMMVLGEGTGIIQIHKTLSRQEKLAHQQKNFLLSVTHELKSPLASIKLSLQTILKRVLTADQQQSLLGNSLKDIERLDDLVENMLLATKIENSSYSFPKDKFNLSELVEKVVERLQVHACNSQTIKCSVSPNIYLIGDAFAMNSVLINLIENAVNYSPENTRVSVTTSLQNGVLNIAVADQGIGIPEREHERIFERFYRVDPARSRETGGTGLGLSIVKHIINKHGGEINIWSVENVGSTFTVRLPLVEFSDGGEGSI